MSFITLRAVRTIAWHKVICKRVAFHSMFVAINMFVALGRAQDINFFDNPSRIFFDEMMFQLIIHNLNSKKTTLNILSD